MPLAVLHVVRPAAGGIRQHVLSLVQFLDVGTVTQSIAAPASFLRALPPLPIHTYPLALAARLAPFADLKAAWRLAGLARGADIVHAHGLRAGWVAALAHVIRPFPFVLTAHNIADGGWLSRLVVRFIGRQTSVVIAVSQAAADSLTDIARAKVRIIPNGVEISHFAALPERGEARRALGIPTAAFAVGCLARLSPEKGVDTLLRAASLLPDSQIVVAGDGPLRSTLEQNLPANVRLLGHIVDTRLLLAAADLLAVPSRAEGQGIAALEAMAAHVPLVASRVGGLAGMLTDGETALLVPPSDAAALASAITRLRDDPALRAHLAENAAHLVHARYGLAQTVALVAELYAECAAPGQTLPSRY